MTEHCYCSSLPGTRCDFCTGIRVAPRRYGIWAGNPDGYKEDPSRCAYEVRGRGAWGPTDNHQCWRKRGHGASALYCIQHSLIMSDRAAQDGAS